MELATLGLGERRTDNGQPFSYSTRNLSLATVSKIEILAKIKNFMINKSVAEALKLYYDSLGSVNPDDPVFSSRKTDEGTLQPITKIAAWQMLNRYANMVGLNDGIGTHTLRKTFGYHLYKKGVALEYIQKMLNHSSPAITLRYIGITQEQLNDIYVELNL